MNFLKRQSIGFYLTVLSIVAGIVGLAFCFVNHGTATFGNIAISPVTMAGSIVAVALGLVILVTGQFAANAFVRTVTDVCFVASGVLLVVAAVSFVADRINTIASALSFAQNAQSMADLQSVIQGTAGLFAAAVLIVAASWFKVRKAA